MRLTTFFCGKLKRKAVVGVERSEVAGLATPTGCCQEACGPSRITERLTITIVCFQFLTKSKLGDLIESSYNYFLYVHTQLQNFSHACTVHVYPCHATELNIIDVG